MEFRPPRFPGAYLGAGIALVGIVLAALLGYRLAVTPVSFVSFIVGVVALLCLVVAYVFLFWSYACWTLRYTITEHHLAIQWANNRQLVPLGIIKDVVLGKDVPVTASPEGVNWFGHHVGRANLAGVGETLFYVTRRAPGEIVYVVTPELSYAVSPSDGSRFVEAIQEAREKGPPAALSPRTYRWPILSLPFWQDRPVLVLAAAVILLNAALFAYVTYVYPTLPTLLPLRYTIAGTVERVGLRSEVFGFPLAALAILLANLIIGFLGHAKERFLTCLLYGSALIAQGVFWAIAVSILR